MGYKCKQNFFFNNINVPSSPFMRSVAFNEAFLNLSLFFIRFLLTLNVLRAPNISGSLSPGGAVS